MYPRIGVKPAIGIKKQQILGLYEIIEAAPQLSIRELLSKTLYREF